MHMCMYAFVFMYVHIYMYIYAHVILGIGYQGLLCLRLHLLFITVSTRLASFMLLGSLLLHLPSQPRSIRVIELCFCVKLFKGSGI